MVCASRRSTGLPLRRCSQKVPRTIPISVRIPNVNPTASGTMFDFGAIAFVSVKVEVLEGRAGVSLSRRMLYAQRGETRQESESQMLQAANLPPYSIGD